MKLNKRELIGYIYLIELEREHRPYSIIHLTIETKKKFLFVIDYESDRLSILKVLIKHVISILKYIFHGKPTNKKRSA